MRQKFVPPVATIDLNDRRGNAGLPAEGALLTLARSIVADYLRDVGGEMHAAEERLADTIAVRLAGHSEKRTQGPQAGSAGLAGVEGPDPLPSSDKRSDAELDDTLSRLRSIADWCERRTLLNKKDIAAIRLDASRLSVPREGREGRQQVVLAFVREAFGEDNAKPQERARRLLEEAMELAQAAGVPGPEANHLMHYVYRRPVGDVRQELGGLGVTILAMAESIGASADAEEQREIARVLAKPRAHWRDRHNAKADAGVADPAPLPKSPA